MYCVSSSERKNLRSDLSSGARPTQVHVAPPARSPLPISAQLVSVGIADDDATATVVLLIRAAGIRVHHVPDVRALAIALVWEAAAAHIRRGGVLVRVVDLAVIVDRVGALLQGVRGVGVGAEERGGVVSDPTVEDKEPPVALVEEPLDLEVVLCASDGGERGEGHAGVDLRIHLYPARDVAVPAALVVRGSRVAVGGVVDEKVR